jgi:hypothetical protein
MIQSTSAPRENDRVDDALESGQHLPPGFAANGPRRLDHPGEPVERFRQSQRHAVFGEIARVLGGVEPDAH